MLFHEIVAREDRSLSPWLNGNIGKECLLSPSDNMHALDCGRSIVESEVVMFDQALRLP